MSLDKYASPSPLQLLTTVGWRRRWNAGRNPRVDFRIAGWVVLCGAERLACAAPVLDARRSNAVNPMSFLIGEFIKIALTIALLAAVAWLYRDLNWLALIAAFIVALKSYIILLFRH